MKTHDIEKRYLWYQAFKSLWFVGAIWLLYYRLFMTDQGVGILDAISFSIGLLAEIPSGALADHFGRKRIAMLGVFLSSIGLFAQGLPGGYPMILLGQTVTTIGWAFRSGADDALFYDALGYEEDSSKWKALVAKGTQVALATTLVTYLIGGYMYNLSPRLPFLAKILMLGGMVALWKIPEVKRARAEKGSRMSTYFTSLKDGVRQLLHKQSIGYLPIIIVVQGLFYTFGYGQLRPVLLVRFNFGASPGAWVLVACGVVTFVLQRLQLRYVDRLTEKRGIIAITLAAATALFLAVLPLGHLGFLIVMAIYAGEYLMEPLISDGLNKHIASTHRATALSAASFLQSLPYVIVAPLIGYLNYHDKLEYYLAGMGVLCLGAAVLYAVKVREKGKLSLDEGLDEVVLH